MTAKSAPQLFRYLRQPGGTALDPRTLLLLISALVMASAAWLLDQQDAVIAGRLPASKTAAQASAEAAATDPEPQEQAARPSESGRLRTLAEFLAKRYKVSQSITLDLVTMAHSAGQQVGLDPLLIIAVMAVESRFNPIAESVMGAKGLMQVIPKYHVDKFREFGGERYAVFDPETNILVGSRILKDYISETGSLNAALQLYVGASSEEDDPYIGKVMTEKQRLQQVLRNSRTRADADAPLAGERLASVVIRH